MTVGLEKVLKQNYRSLLSIVSYRIERRIPPEFEFCSSSGVFAGWMILSIPGGPGGEFGFGRERYKGAVGARWVVVGVAWARSIRSIMSTSGSARSGN